MNVLVNGTFYWMQSWHCLCVCSLWYVVKLCLHRFILVPAWQSSTWHLTCLALAVSRECRTWCVELTWTRSKDCHTSVVSLQKTFSLQSIFMKGKFICFIWLCVHMFFLFCYPSVWKMLQFCLLEKWLLAPWSMECPKICEFVCLELSQN